MATTWKSTPELCKINLFEHFWSAEILVIGGLTYTESNIKSHRKLALRSPKYIIVQNLQSGMVEIASPPLTEHLFFLPFYKLLSRSEWIISSDAPNHNKHNMYINVIISYSFTTAILPTPPQTAEETWTTNLSPAILNILPHFLTSLCSPCAYLCNMLIQRLSFKYDICHKGFEPKSAAASWNVTLSCFYFHRTFQHHMVNCACKL